MTIPRGLWIREARPADFREVAAMHYPVWRKSYTGIIPETEFPRLGDPARWAGLDYPAKLTPDGWAMWLAECAGELVGMSIFGPDTSGADRMELGSLYVGLSAVSCCVWLVASFPQLSWSRGAQSRTTRPATFTRDTDFGSTPPATSGNR
jgi:hypothetical protein